jgi:hypothetical protein
MPNPLVLIHGYSDKGESFRAWKKKLVAKGLYKPKEIQICSYRTLTNEVTIKDIAEGFDRALKINLDIQPDQPFDAIVHSTGMLVLRSWLTVYGRHERLKRLIAIAPASFGSPLAHKGRSWIGALFKGNREAGPDFMEAGNLVLDGLELASRFTWDLAHKDLLGDDVFYGPGDDTPYVFTFCGDTAYKGLRGAVTKSPGTDGTVRWAGCSLNTRKIKLDFTTPPGQGVDIGEWRSDKRTNLVIPFIPMRGLNHATILEDPSEELVGLVAEALQVDSKASYDAWIKKATASSAPTLKGMEKWQQFIIRALDERGDPITDFNLQLYKKDNPTGRYKPVNMDVHTYAADNSLRCFHVNLDDIAYEGMQSLRLEFMASSGTQLLGYYEYRSPDNKTEPEEGQPTFTMDLTPLLKNEDVRFFYPFTTTLIEIVLNREPLPLRDVNKITQFLVDE